MTSYPHWVFDGSEIPDPFGYGERAVEFFRRLKHPKSKLPRQQFTLDPWQERIIRRIYGPRHPDCTRIVKTVVLLVPRGNRKTSLAAGLALLHTIGPERVPGGEALFAASDRNQASIGFREALSIVLADKRIDGAVRISDAVNSTKSLTFKKDGTRLETISADAARQHGRTPNFCLVDELHIWKGRDLWEAIQTGLAKTPGSLLVIATTAGRGQHNVAFEIVEDARRVARGEVDDPSILPVLFEPQPGDDWTDEAVYHRVNPGLKHGYPDIEGLRQRAKEAARRPSDKDAFQQFHLNLWLDHSASPFVSMATYDLGNEPINLADLESDPCWLGVDLSSHGDLTVVVAAWRADDGYTVWPWFFCPSDNLRERERASGAPYVRWTDEKLITATPGNVVDFRAVEATIRDIYARFNVQEIAFDPALARNMLNNLGEDGLPAVEHRQGSLSMMPSIAALEHAILGGKLRHGGHEILRWCFSNVEAQTNPQGHKIRLTKGHRQHSIDGAVAAAMAVGRASLGESSGYSIWADPSISASDMVI